MDGGLKIFWTTTAKKQRDLVFDYWNKRNKNTRFSRKLNLAIKERTELIRHHPKMGRRTVFDNTRVISMGNYRIYYRYLHPKIIITAFWDNRQDPEKLQNIFRKET